MAYRHNFAALFCVAIAFTGCEKAKSQSEDVATNGPAEPHAAQGCPAERASDCADAQTRIDALATERDQALAAGDSPAVVRASLELNHQIELLALLQDGTSETAQFTALESKYQQLGVLVEAEIARGAENSGAATKPTDPAKPGVLPASRSPLLYQPTELAAVTRIFHDFGDLYIAETSQAEEVKATTIPWAGYWYPFRGNDLFDGASAPLVKLDLALTNMGRPGRTAAYERDRNANYPMDTWEGRCFAWALASATSVEPRAPVTVHGVTFTISDQKALLTKVSEMLPIDQYGIRYDGDATTDATFQDMRPEAFHRLAQGILGVQHRSFTIDDDPGIQVWSKPVYRLRWTIAQDPTVQNAYIVVANPWMTKNRESVDNLLTTIDDRAAPSYKYRLYVDPAQVQDGRFKVIAGEWLEGSLNSHPDTVTLPRVGGALQSNNPEINANLDVVRQILGISG